MCNTLPILLYCDDDEYFDVDVPPNNDNIISYDTRTAVYYYNIVARRIMLIDRLLRWEVMGPSVSLFFFFCGR